MVNIDVTGMGENISLSRDVRTEDLEKDVTRGRESADKDRRKGSMFRLIILFFRLEKIKRPLGRSLFFRGETPSRVLLLALVFSMKAVKPLVLVLGIKVMEIRLVTKVGVRNDVNSGVNVTAVAIISKTTHCSRSNYSRDCLYNERVADAEVTTDITSYGLSHEFLDSKGRKLDITALGLDRELANANVLNRWMDVKLNVLGRKDGDGRKTLRVGRKNKVDDMRRGFRRLRHDQ